MNAFRRAIGHLLSCKEASRLLSQAQEAPMTAWQRTPVRWHLAVCNMCRAFEKQLWFMREAMRRYRE
jgi:hypothetical protein